MKKEDLLAVVKDAVDSLYNGNKTKAALDWGINSDTLIKWLSGKRNPKIENLMAIVDKVQAYDADRPESKEQIQRVGTNAPVETFDGKILCKVPLIGTAGAGNPFDRADTIENFIVIPKEYHRRNCVVLKVEGDSMTPKIPNGSYVGVVPMDGRVIEGHIYLLDLPYLGLVVKRIRLGSNGRLEMYSDNPAYKPCAITDTDYESIVVGEVVWILSMAE